MADTERSASTGQQNQNAPGRSESRQMETSRSQQSLGRARQADLIGGSPFMLMRRLADEMDRAFDRMFDDFGFSSSRWLPRSLASPWSQSGATWAPRIEAYQDHDTFIVRAELPGLKKDDVVVNITDDAITLQGQRRQERGEQREGFYHNEWSYGSFHRAIPLPDDAIADSAEASFKDGVLEIRVQTPPHEVNRGRKLEIKEASQQSSSKP